MVVEGGCIRNGRSGMVGVCGGVGISGFINS